MPLNNFKSLFSFLLKIVIAVLYCCKCVRLHQADVSNALEAQSLKKKPSNIKIELDKTESFKNYFHFLRIEFQPNNVTIVGEPVADSHALKPGNFRISVNVQCPVGFGMKAKYERMWDVEEQHFISRNNNMIGLDLPTTDYAMKLVHVLPHYTVCSLAVKITNQNHNKDNIPCSAKDYRPSELNLSGKIFFTKTDKDQ